jgi:hypothetical protein
MVDAYTCVEQNRLKYIRDHHKNLCCELYRGFQDTLEARDVDVAQVGQKFLFPSTFFGGPRKMVQLYQDAMAIVRKFGRPDLFFTFMCNPKLPRITAELLEGQTPKDHPDLVSRVLQLKLTKMIKDINDEILGDVITKIWVIEFQKAYHIAIF